RGAGAVRVAAVRPGCRSEGRPGDRLRLVSGGAAPGDCARGHRPLHGDSGDRQEDGPAGGDGAEGEARLRRGNGGRDAAFGQATPGRARRAGRAWLLARRGGGSTLRHRSRGAAGGTCARGVEESRMSQAAAEETQFLAPKIRPDEDELERSLRPRSLDEFVGQERVKEQLSITLDAAKARKEALDHLLLIGPPGLGKTSLAFIVREELGVGLRSVAGPALERKGDVAAILTGLQERDVLFVDEIHRLSRAVEEILYPALEDFRLDIVVGQGPAARTLTLDLPPFTLIGATTRTGLLTTPLRDR